MVEQPIQQVFTEKTPLQTLAWPAPIDVFQCQTTVGTVFTALDSADFQIRGLSAVNVSGADETVTVYFVPSGGSAGASNTVVYQRKIPIGGTSWIFTEEYTAMLQPGMTLEALCGTNDAINIFGWGMNYQGQYGG